MLFFSVRFYSVRKFPIRCARSGIGAPTNRFAHRIAQSFEPDHWTIYRFTRRGMKALRAQFIILCFGTTRLAIWCAFVVFGAQAPA